MFPTPPSVPHFLDYGLSTIEVAAPQVPRSSRSKQTPKQLERRSSLMEFLPRDNRWKSSLTPCRLATPVDQQVCPQPRRFSAEYKSRLWSTDSAATILLSRPPLDLAQETTLVPFALDQDVELVELPPQHVHPKPPRSQKLRKSSTRNSTHSWAMLRNQLLWRGRMGMWRWLE